MYVNLKLHSDYEFLVSSCKIERCLEKAKNIGLTSLSISNSKLYNTINNYILSKSYGIKYIFSLEVDNFNLYAKNENGYRNLIALASLEKIEMEDILKYRSDLVVLTGSFKSIVYEYIEKNNLEKAIEKLKSYKENFLDFYLELPCHLAKTKHIEKYISLINMLDLNYVITNDAYYIEKNEEYLQDILLAIKENKKLTNLKKTYPNGLYFKTYKEIETDFENVDRQFFQKGILASVKIAEECNVDIEFDKLKLPSFTKTEDEKELLFKIAFSNLEKIGKKDSSIYVERLNYELEIIDKMKFNSYFLITKDIVDYARKNDILVGVGRGSASGSLVSYLLGITKVDPIKYNLIFERFLNEKRQGMPDIDIDIEALKRDKLIAYIFKKYGLAYVANIVSFSTLKEKQLEKDLERVMAKRSNLDTSPILYNVRHTSIHASGIVISNRPLSENVPINYDKISNTNISQYDMVELEKIGLLKLDLLGLTNLDIISECLKQINLSLDKIELDNKKAFEMYNNGDTVGIFQAEASGMTKMIQKIGIHSVEDISLALALYRPGPLNSGMIDSLIERKKKKSEITYDIDNLNKILDETYGVIIYQEQVMKIATKIADFSLVEADILRKAISKKKANLLEKMKDKFVSGAIAKGLDEKKIISLYEQIQKFGEYGFNKAHSISYGITSYYTAYLKANYTKEYMVALLNNKITDFTKLNLYYNELLKFDIRLLGVDINKSDVYFKIENDAIRFSIYSLSGISKSFAVDIVEEREKNGKFLDINDFSQRMIKYGLNEKNFVILAESGAFLCFNLSRLELVKNVNIILKIASDKNKDKENVTRQLFYTGKIDMNNYTSKNYDEYSMVQINEKEIINLGIALTYTSSDKYKIIYSLFKKNTNYALVYIHKRDLIYINGIEYKLKNLDLYPYINKLCLISIKNNKIENIYLLKEKLFNRATTIHINLDNLNSSKKEELKDIVRKNGGYNRIYFYQNSKKLESSTYIEFNMKILTELVEKFGIKNIRIKI